jgi:hypothetical protein
LKSLFFAHLARPAVSPSLPLLEQPQLVKSPLLLCLLHRGAGLLRKRKERRKESQKQKRMRTALYTLAATASVAGLASAARQSFFFGGDGSPFLNNLGNNDVPGQIPLGDSPDEPHTPASPPVSAADRSAHWRPQVHFSAPDNWLNDPNGLFVDSKGVWHLYYQCK